MLIYSIFVSKAVEDKTFGPPEVLMVKLFQLPQIYAHISDTFHARVATYYGFVLAQHSTRNDRMTRGNTYFLLAGSTADLLHKIEKNRYHWGRYQLQRTDLQITGRTSRALQHA